MTWPQIVPSPGAEQRTGTDRRKPHDHPIPTGLRWTLALGGALLLVGLSCVVALFVQGATRDERVARVAAETARVAAQTARQTYDACLSRKANSTANRDNADAILRGLVTATDPGVLAARDVLQAQREAAARNAALDCGPAPQEVPQ